MMDCNTAQKLIPEFLDDDMDNQELSDFLALRACVDMGMTLFDVYRGEKILIGKKQYALNFVLQDVERTLTDNDVENTMNRVLEALKNELGAILR